MLVPAQRSASPCTGRCSALSTACAQAARSAVKLPLLFLATLAICLPTLYLFNLVFGARLSVMQAVTLIMASITVTSVLTLAFAPISLFFLISANNYAFFKLLNVAHPGAHRAGRPAVPDRRAWRAQRPPWTQAARR